VTRRKEPEAKASPEALALARLIEARASLARPVDEVATLLARFEAAAVARERMALLAEIDRRLASDRSWHRDPMEGLRHFRTMLESRVKA